MVYVNESLAFINKFIELFAIPTAARGQYPLCASKDAGSTAKGTEITVIPDRRLGVRRPVELHSRETADDPVGEADPSSPIAS